MKEFIVSAYEKLPSGKQRRKRNLRSAVVVPVLTTEANREKDNASSLKNNRGMQDNIIDHIHVLKENITIKNCGPRLTVGVDIKFTPLVNSLDGRSGVAEIYEIRRDSPAEKAGLQVGQRILSIFGIIAHNKEEFFDIFIKMRSDLKLKSQEKHNYRVNMIIERPCQIAKAEAERAAEKYIRENIYSPTLLTAGFSCRCITCKSTSRSLCRDLPLMKEIEQRKRRARRHSATVCRNKKSNSPEPDRKCYSKVHIRDFLKRNSSENSPTTENSECDGKPSSAKITSTSDGSRATLGQDSRCDQDRSQSLSPVVLKTVFSFSQLSNEGRHTRRATVS